MTSYASKKLSEELQKAVQARSAKPAAPVPVRIDGQYRVSAEVAGYLKKMADYREQAKKVRVGSY